MRHAPRFLSACGPSWPFCAAPRAAKRTRMVRNRKLLKVLAVQGFGRELFSNGNSLLSGTFAPFFFNLVISYGAGKVIRAPFFWHFHPIPIAARI